eukprot:jgi/Botrbrau1/10698/Bobra.357_1s0002.1
MSVKILFPFILATVVWRVEVHAQTGSKDFIDSPFVGQGVPPPNGVDVFMSIYLDRLLHLNQLEYYFHAVMWAYLSWEDERAATAVKQATQTFNETGVCQRPCYNIDRPLPGAAACCDTLWLPTFIIRNIEEYPQGRSQPAHIQVLPRNVVTWRVQFAAQFYTPMDMMAFPFDTQKLMVHLQLSNPDNAPKVRIFQSATGLSLFSRGKGDDLSGWRIINVTMDISEQSFSQQFRVTRRAFFQSDRPRPFSAFAVGKSRTALHSWKRN